MKYTSVDLGLKVIPNKNLPDTWDYQQSVNKVKSLIVSFKNVTNELLHELWVAREMLSDRGSWSRNNCYNWTGYLEDIGLLRMTAHRWLSQYIPEERRKKTPGEIAEQKRLSHEAFLKSKAEVDRKKEREAREGEDREKERQYFEQGMERLKEDEARRKDGKDEYNRFKKELYEKLGITTDAEYDRKMAEYNKRIWEREAQKKRFREKIRMTGDNQHEPFFEVLEEYMASLDANRQMEACHNIIKYCKGVVNALQVEAASA